MKTAQAGLTIAVMAAGVLACASPTPRLRHDLIVEGREESYSAFEAAAKACGFTTIERFTDSAGETHLNLYNVYPITKAGRCTLKWVDDHPEAGLVVSGH